MGDVSRLLFVLPRTLWLLNIHWSSTATRTKAGQNLTVQQCQRNWWWAFSHFLLRVGCPITHTETRTRWRISGKENNSINEHVEGRRTVVCLRLTTGDDAQSRGHSHETDSSHGHKRKQSLRVVFSWQIKSNQVWQAPDNKMVRDATQCNIGRSSDGRNKMFYLFSVEDHIQKHT